MNWAVAFAVTVVVLGAWAHQRREHDFQECRDWAQHEPFWRDMCMRARGY